MIAYTQGDTIGRETAVSTLRVDLKGAERLPDWVFSLTRLQELHVFNARFGHVHFADWPWPELTRLKLVNCGLERLSTSVFLPLNIQELDLSENPGLEWPLELLRKSTRLQILNFSRNELTDPELEGLELLPSLRTLLISHNQLRRLPTAALQLEQLRVLDISDNQIRTIPQGISRLGRLDQLLAGNNSIRKLPETIGALEALSQLQLGNNRLSTLPAGLKQCMMLRRLDLRRNKLQAFPEGLDQLPWLSELDLARNQISTLPVGLGVFRQLAKLDLSRNGLTAFSLTAAQLPKLRELKLDRNRLRQLPDFPPELFSLSATDNAFDAIPESVMTAPDLKELFLDRNQIRQLPDSFGRLENTLVRLSMTGNPVQSAPEELLPLQQLKELHGLISAARRKELLIAQQSARTLNLPAELVVPFYHLLRSAKDILPDLGPEAILPALNHPVGSVAARVRRYVQKSYGRPLKGKRLGKGSVLAILGRTFFDKARLSERLTALGIHLQDEYDPDECTHILLGFPQINQEIPPGRQVIINEKQLARRLDQLEKKPLLKERSTARLERLRQLLTSPDTTNIRLGFRMITGNGLPPKLWNELLTAYYLSERDPALQLQIKSYIRLRLEDEGKNRFFAALTPQLIKWGKIKPEKEALLRRNRFDLETVQNYLR